MPASPPRSPSSAGSTWMRIRSRRPDTPRAERRRPTTSTSSCAAPAASDVHHNFVQRWNEASDRSEPGGVWPDASSAGPLAFPARLSRPAGPVPVQITRTVLAGRYADATAAPGGRALSDRRRRGERARAVSRGDRRGAAARSTSRTRRSDPPASSTRSTRRSRAASRWCSWCRATRTRPSSRRAASRTPRSSSRSSRSSRATRTSRSPRSPRASGGNGLYDEIYVHSKLALVDDGWCTIGSTNVAERSFHHDTELNASFWHPQSVRALRRELLLEHLGLDTGEQDDRAALRAVPRDRAEQRGTARGARAARRARVCGGSGEVRAVAGWFEAPSGWLGGRRMAFQLR